MRKISLVADASALVSLASVSLLSLVLNEFDVVVSDVVVRELKEMSTYANRDFHEKNYVTSFI